MRLKPGVKFDGVQAPILYALWVAEEVMGEATVTSLLDGQHSPHSKHYQGLAVDLRTRHLPRERIEKVASELRSRLGDDYDVVIEKTHLHVEFDPKGD